ncbi:MAG: hypothetical protein A2171_01345 [Candidatus Levybacteria bacterium RBG_13_35_9]|nr:MAG: hypothetical protein A2171_01345 [Candidatus Levybacteria bacterium RBG_13_35_9]
MKKIIFVLVCFLIACLIFVLVVYLLNRRPAKGALQVTSSPKSKVYLNEKLIGETPLCQCEANKMLNEGEYTIRLVPSEGDFEPFQRKIKISPKVLTVVDRAFAQTALSQASIISLTSIQDKKDAQISVISFPDKSQVLLDSDLVGQTPVLLKNITQSDHEIKIVRQGYKEKILRVKTVLGYKLEAIVYLGIDPEIATASAVLISSPSAKTTSQTITIQETPTGFLRVRKEPTVSSEEVGRVNPGDIFNLLEEKTGWYKIQLKDKTQGWVSSQYANK